MYISFRRKVYRYCRKLLHLVSIGLIKGGPTPINAGKWYWCSWGQQSSFLTWRTVVVNVYNGQKRENGKKFAAEYCCIGKKLYLCTTANEGSVCARRFARAKKEKGLIAQLV